MEPWRFLKYPLIAAALGVCLCGTAGEARAGGDLFRSMAWGTPLEVVRRTYNLIGPTDIGGHTNVYVSHDAPFGDLYGDLIANFQGGKLARFRLFLGSGDSGDRFRSGLRVMSDAGGWTQIFLKAGEIEIPLLIKPVTDPFRPPPAPPSSFAEARSVWIEGPIPDEALFIYKQKRSYREFMKVVTAHRDALRAAVVTLHKGFVTVAFVPAHELINDLEHATVEEPTESVAPQEPEGKDLELLKPVAPK